MDDFDKTIPPRRAAGDGMDDMTMPGKRDRKPDGRFSVGDLIMNRYKVLAELGQGGMGVVYKCFDETAGIEIALKALPPELSHNTLEMEDIKDNFQLVHNLHHPNIASSNTLEKDNSNGNYYLIMECCEGEDLRRWIKRKRRVGELKLDDVLPIVKQIADALDYAHEMKIIHRDIKPGNIMIDGAGKIKVLDFGLAAQIHTSMTRVSMAYHGTSGTGPYMAPEQWRGRAQGASSDQYALAVMTYEILAGHLPFESSDAAVLKQAVLDETPEEIAGISPIAQNAIKRAMSKEPSERFENCSDFVSALNGKKVNRPEHKSVQATPDISNPLLRRAQIFVETGEFQSALSYCDRLLDDDPENGYIYFCKAMAELQVSYIEQLIDIPNFEDNKSFQLAKRFADDTLKIKFQSIEAAVNERERQIQEAKLKAEQEAKLKAEQAEEEKAKLQYSEKLKHDSEHRCKLLTEHLELEEDLQNRDDMKKCLEYAIKAEEALFKDERLLTDDIVQPVKEYSEQVFAAAGPLAEKRKMLDEIENREYIKIVIIFFILLVIYLVLIFVFGVKGCRADKEPQSVAIQDVQQNSDGNIVLDLGNDITLEMVKIKAGTFMMGSPEGELGSYADETQHQVTLTKDYWLGKFEVTQAQYEAIMGNNPSNYKGGNRPVEQVSWNDAKDFCNKLNERYAGKLSAGYKFDLPTEAQWEYACRAGTTTALNNGTNLTSTDGECSNLDKVGWYDKNYGSHGHKAVGQKHPNNWGLYDMHGNVWEWCRDRHEGYSGDATDPVGPSSGSYRVFRGGCWSGNARVCRSACRNDSNPGNGYNYLGFRLALVPIDNKK